MTGLLKDGKIGPCRSAPRRSPLALPVAPVPAWCGPWCTW